MKITEVAENTYHIMTPVSGVGLVLSTYFIDVDGGLLIEPGPAASLPSIEEGMKRIGMERLSWIIPTHIHMDHAGGTGQLARKYSNAKVISHPISVRHFVNPVRLIESTRLTYGADFELLYGSIIPVLESQIVVPKDGEIFSVGGRNIQILYAPGHAPHHIAIFDEHTKVLFCGECLGMDTNEPLPAAAAPGFNMKDCLETMRKMRDLAPEILCYSHGSANSDSLDRIDTATRNTHFYGDIIRESLENQESPEEIGRKVMEHARPNIPDDWEEDMAWIWQTGMVQGYSMYYRNGG